MGFADHVIVKDIKSGKIMIWGRNDNGQMGIQSLIEERAVRNAIELPKKAKRVKIGECHTVIILENGKVELCGWNYYGQLGNGTTTSEFILKELPMPAKIIDAACGASYTLLFTEQYDVYGFGKNEYGNLGLGFNKTKLLNPRKLEGKFKQAYCGYWHTFLVDLNNKFHSCGSNQYGQLLLKHYDDQTNIVPMDNFDHTIRSIAGGYECTIVIDSNYRMHSIGYNNFGLCGVGHTNNVTKIVELTQFLSSHTILFDKIEIGYEHCVAKTRDNMLFSWGYNQHGQLGLGDNEKRTSPSQIIELPEPISKFWCGHNQSYVISQTKNVYSCGYNTYGELGLGDNNNRNVLTKISTISNIDIVDKQSYWYIFKVLYFARTQEHAVWRRVPIEIIREICKFI